MAISEINDGKLLAEDRYHITQEDVPYKSADEMKEFMDYIPRRVIIPKLNEVIAELETKAERDSVYTTDEAYNKTETDEMLSKKADRDSTYTVSDVNRLLNYKVDGDSDKAILDVAVLPDSSDVGYGGIYRCNGVLYTKDVDTGEFMVINQTPTLTDSPDVINDVDALPQATGDTLGRLYRYKGTLYESVITKTDNPSGDITTADLEPLWCSYKSVSELKAYLDTLEFDPIGDDGEYSSRALCILLYGVDELEEYLSIKKHAGYPDGYKLVTDYVAGEWSLDDWVNGRVYLASFIGEKTGEDMSRLSVIANDDLFEKLTVKREYGYSPVATALSVGSMTGLEFAQSVTLTENSDSVTINQNVMGEDLSVYRELFVLFTGGFELDGTTGVRVTNGGNGNFYVYNNFTVTADVNYGWWFAIEKLAECYDDVNSDNYSIKKCEYAGNMLNGFNVSNSIHSQGTSSKANVISNISCLQSRYESDSAVKVMLSGNRFNAGAVFKVFGRRK